MEHIESRFFKERPKDLCKMCGRCCRCSTTAYPHSELLKLRDAGDEGACDFLELFEPYESLEEAKKVDRAIVENIVKKTADSRPEEDYTFYRCRYIGDDNKCTIYERRKVLCDHFPSSPWAVVPVGCGYEGWLFLKREEIKQQVRKMKEELIELNLLKTKTTNLETLNKISLVEEKIIKNIEHYKKYGSLDW